MSGWNGSQRHSPELTQVDMNGKKKKEKKSKESQHLLDSRFKVGFNRTPSRKNIAALNKDSKILSGVENFLQLHTWRSKKQKKKKRYHQRWALCFGYVRTTSVISSAHTNQHRPFNAAQCGTKILSVIVQNKEILKIHAAELRCVFKHAPRGVNMQQWMAQ